MASMAKGALKGAAVSGLKSRVMESAADENSKLGGFVKKGKAVAEKAIKDSPVVEKVTHAAEEALSKNLGGGPVGDFVAKHVVSEAKKDPKKAMAIASAIAKADKAIK